MRQGLKAIWEAGPDDVPDVLELLLARADWLAARGSDQWYNFAEKRDRLEETVSAGRTYIMRDDDSGKPLGTITFTDPDPDFWTPAEQQIPSLYLAKLATDPREAGQGLGRLLLDFAIFKAIAAREIREIRFDVWRTATDLQRYYERQGWRHLRTVAKPGRFSGALFTREVPKVMVNIPPSGTIIAPSHAGWTPPPERPWEPGEREHGGAGE